MSLTDERETALKWTDALPTKQGWYWINGHLDPIAPAIVFVMRLGTGDLVVDDVGYAPRFVRLEMFAEDVAKWAGPIPEPEEPSA